MRIGIRLAISSLVLASIVVSAVGVHLLWWRTAEANSHTLAATINDQIVAAVRNEVDAITTQARAAHTAIRTLFVQNVLETREADKREFVFLSQLQAQPSISWVAFGWPDDAFFAAHKLGDLGLEMMEIAPVDGVVKRRVDKYQVVVGDIQFEKRRFEATDFHVTEQEWYRKSIASDDPAWFEVTNYPVGRRPSIAYAGPVDVYQKRQGVLAVMIENTRLAQFLSQLAVGKTGAAFILRRDGTTIAAPDPNADEVNMQRADQPLLPIARGAFMQAGNMAGGDKTTARRERFIAGGRAYAVTLTPLAFPGWTLATVIPEAEFLGPIETTIRRLLVGLAILILAAGILSAWLGRRVIARPLITVVDELKHVERFELDQVRRHPSRITELDNLSSAIADMAGGLAAFRKYIPADLVKMLVREGIEPRPGGAMRTLTVLFADIAGFTGLSERLGDRIIPLLSSYLDTMSREVSAHGGTIDKFIGDAVMAFWGAPAANADHAVDACRAALACQAALRASGLTDDRGQPLRVRIGINSGDHAGRQYRIGIPAQLHGDRRCRECRQPARRRQQGIRHRHHHRRGNAPPRRRPHPGARTRPADGLWTRGRTGDLRIARHCRTRSRAAGLGCALRIRPRRLSRPRFRRRRATSFRSCWRCGRRISPRASCSNGASNFSSRRRDRIGKQPTR